MIVVLEALHWAITVFRRALLVVSYLRTDSLAPTACALTLHSSTTPSSQALAGGGGVDRALHQAAGPELDAACEALPQVSAGVRCPTGESRLTPGFRLKAAHLIHTVGPVYRSAEASAPLLRAAYRSALALAAAPETSPAVRSLALPAISTGAFGYPSNEAAQVAVGAIKEAVGPLEKVELVLNGRPAFQIFVAEATKLLGEPRVQSLVGGGEVLDLTKKG